MWETLQAINELSVWIYPLYVIVIKLNCLLKKMSIDFSAKLHRWSIICNLISLIDGFTIIVFQSLSNILYVLFSAQPFCFETK